MRRNKIIGFGVSVALGLLILPTIASAAPEPAAPVFIEPRLTNNCYNADDLDADLIDNADPDTTDFNLDFASGTNDTAATSIELFEIPPSPAPPIFIGIDAGPTVPLGTWSVALTAAQRTDGFHLLHAFAVNGLGVGRSLAGARVFCVDTVPPPAPTLAFPTALNVGVSCVTNPFTFSGTAEPGGEVIVEEQPVAPGTSMWTVAADSTGAWSISASHELLVGDHPLTVVVRQRDGGRNEGPNSAAVTFDVCDDKTAPPAPVITLPSAGGLPSGASLLIAGTTVVEIPSVRVFVRERAVNWLNDISWMDKQFREVEATVDAFGGWSYLETFPSSGITTLTAIAMDDSGNRSVESAPVVKMIDVDAPEARISLPSGFLLADVWLSAPSFAGTAKDNYGLDHIEIVYDPLLLGAPAATNPAACAQCPTDFDDVADPFDTFSPPTATWSDAPTLDLGLYEMQVTAVDLAGNRSAVASMFVLIVNP